MKTKEDFVHLHVHSDMSALDGCGTVKGYVEEVARRGAPAIAMTDHGTMRGYYKLHEQCEKNRINPIYGIEFYVANDMHRRGLTDMERFHVTKGLKKSEHRAAIKANEEKEGIRDRWHLTVWARNDKGLKNLFRLSTKAYTEGFYYKPRIDINALKEHSEGLSIGTGCASSVIHDRVSRGQVKKALEISEDLRETFGENMWLEVQPHALGMQEEANKFNLELKKRWGKNAKLLATQDAHYVGCGDACHHEVLLCIGTGDTMRNPDRFRFSNDEFWLKTRKEMWSSFRKNHSYMTKAQVKEALNSTMEFSEQVEAKVNVDFHAALLPHVVVPGGFSDEWDYLKSLCLRGWIWRKIEERVASEASKRGYTVSNMKKVYKERLSYELSAIYRQNFVSYFLIVHDLYDWAKSKKIMCGPGRGSVAGSLVSFLLGFTAVDPIEHNLIFERFIHPERLDLPDIDMDFEDERRQEILNYLRAKYGAENVAQIATVGKLAGKQCLKDVSRVLGVPFLEVQEITGSLIEVEARADDEEGMLEKAFSEIKVCREFDEKYPEVLDHAVALEGMAKTLGIHAAGIVVAPDEVSNYVPLETRKYKGQSVVVTALDMRGVAAMGLVKLDVLGLKMLTVFRDCINAVKDSKGIEIDLEEVEMDDKEVLGLFTKQDFSGVFQFDTHSMEKVSKGVKFESFGDIVALNALNRPGTTRSGLAEQYVERKNDPELAKKDIFHRKVSKITSDTLGIIVYQEHVIRIFVEVAGYDAGKADDVRRAISKSKGDEEINKERVKFIKGAKKHSGLTEEEATKVMNAIVKFGSYSFNKAHATAYAMIAYWGQYLKCHYPLEYYWALLRNEQQAIKVQTIAKDAKRKGIKILPPNANISEKSFTIDSKRGVILCGLLDIKGVGEAAASSIVENRPYKGFLDFLGRVDRRKCHRGVIIPLAQSGAMDGMFPNVKWFIDNIEHYWKRIQKHGLDSKEVRLDLINSAREPDYTKEEKQIIALKVNPVAFSKHPLDVYKKFLKDNIAVKVVSPDKADFFKKYHKKSVYLIGVIQKKKISRVGDFHSGETPSEEKRKRMFWGAQTAALHIEGSDNSHVRIKFDRHIFDEMLPIIDSKEGTPIIVSASIDSKYKTIRANFAVSVEEMRKKIEKGEKLSLWESVVNGQDPVSIYPWKTPEEKKRWTSELEKKKNIKVCGVITNLKLTYDKRGMQMAFFGLLRAGEHIEVVCFASTWLEIKEAVEKAKDQSRLIIIQLERVTTPDKGTSYFFNGGYVKVMKKSLLA